MGYRASFRFGSVLCLFMLLALNAVAQPTATEAAAAAEALFDEGKKLMIAGNFAEACGKFEQSQRLDAGVGTLIYLADCYEKSGRSASAWVTFREAAAAARAAGQADREALARSRAAGLEPKLAKLVIDVPTKNDVPGLSIHRGSSDVARPLWGTALPIDAGQHEIRAEAPGRRAWTTRVTAADGAAPLRVEIPSLEPDDNRSDTSSALRTATPMPSVEAPPNRDAKPVSAWQKNAGFVLSGAGIVAGGVGGYFWLHGRSQHEDALGHCNPNCDDTARSLQSDAKHSLTLGNVALIGGAALLTAGVVLIVTAPSKSDNRVVVRAGVPALGIGGTF